MRRLLLILALGGLLTPMALGESGTPVEGLGMGTLSRPMSVGLQRPASATRLSLELEVSPPPMDLNHFLTPRPGPPPNAFQRLLLAADKGAYSALAVGYLGTLVGAWEDETALALMGAGAVLGTLVEGVTGLSGSGISISVAPDR
jgi:hypothetical protein